MANSKPAEAPTSAAVAPKNEGNPAFRAMGLPRLRKKLPSRNWLIFFGVVGSWTAAVLYDRSERRRIQQKYCNAVSHLADEQQRSNSMPRKIRIFLEAPPGDYLNAARDYFKEYIKPILVASALDWEVFEGRKEGDVRWKLAETIRQQRRKAGEGPQDGSQEPDVDDIIKDMRQRAGITDSAERGGDLVIGRHTWKEYIRGLHEGWLGPTSLPKPVSPASDKDGEEPPNDTDSSRPFDKPGEISDLAAKAVTATLTDQPLSNNPSVNADSHGHGDEAELAAREDAPAIPSGDEQQKEADPEDTDKKGDEKKPEPDLTIPYIRPAEYSSASLATSTPGTLAPTVAVGFPHLLGFLNTPIRIWRFLHRRQIAENAGATVTAFILAHDEDVRPFDETGHTSYSGSDTAHDSEEGPQSELQSLLKHEESDWHKIARKPNDAGQEDKERPWQESMITEPTLTSRMRTIDIKAFVSRSGLADSVSQPRAGPSDIAGTVIANAAGNVLAGSSGGEEQDQAAQFGPKVIEWKGSADRMDPLTWKDFFKGMVGMELDKRPKPWQQGFEGNEDE